MRFNLNLPLDIPMAAVFPQLFLLLPLAWLITRMGRWRRWCALSVGILVAAALLRPVWGFSWRAPLTGGRGPAYNESDK